ncbi:hypothetical protein CK203_037367 [Vitis vinifera]|uniref:Reverse transcriptase domain-containing protein n=1 Tax=Vitis vinifera TaxID=29760 RepID=A0A438H9B6_VITVI|nr:hypothetical protein CK203_037367 [Vitis vinifera]
MSWALGLGGWSGFGVGISTAKFSVLVNGGASRLLLEFKGLCQGDPLSPYHFVLGMEVLSALIRRAVDGGFISGCRIRGRGRMEMNVSHILLPMIQSYYAKQRKSI